MAAIITCFILSACLFPLTTTENEQSGISTSTSAKTSTAETPLRYTETNDTVASSPRETVPTMAEPLGQTTMASPSGKKDNSKFRLSVDATAVTIPGEGSTWMQGSSEPAQQQPPGTAFHPPALSPSLTTATVAGCSFAQWQEGAEYLMNVTKDSTNAMSSSALEDWINCETRVRVPAGNVMDAFFEDAYGAPFSSCRLQVSICLTEDASQCGVQKTFSNTDPQQSCCREFYRFTQDTVYLYVNAYSCSVFDIRLHFRAVPFDLRKSLTVVNTSSSSGYVTTPGYDDNKEYPSNMWAMFDLNITVDEVVLISFPHFDLENHTSCRYDSLKLYAVNDSGVFSLKTWCGFQDIPSMIFYTGIRLQFISDYVVQNTGFEMMFTILPKDKEPKMVDHDLFDCAVPHYEDFAQHFNCNLAVNCLGLEDEMNCDYTSPDCGPGLFDAGNKCYTYSRLQRVITWYDAYYYCLGINQTLVSPSSFHEWRNFLGMTRHGRKVSTVYTGLRTTQASGAAVPALYQGMWQWTDKTMGLYVHLLVQRRSVPSCTSFMLQYNADSLQTVSCVSPRDARYVCEKWKSSVDLSPESPDMPSLGSNYTWSANVSVVSCSSGHVVRDFLSCDLQSQCHEDRYASPCVLRGHIPLFQCDHSSQFIHYTMVCDFRLDCSDGSDEGWCLSGQCPEDGCRSGQCISSQDRCDGMQHCVDASDENCPQMIESSPVPVPPPALVMFDGRGRYTLHPMNQSDHCPPTHFKCADGYCLPLYVRCNGVEDCTGHEDEADCETYSCPGFFRCRGSRVCLHPDHVCDGVLHCPQHDDELLCQLTCPDLCHCQGLAFACPRRFRASHFPSLRYLDVSGSSMTMSDLRHNFHLVHLRMSRCELEVIKSVPLPNLQILDVSHNLLTSVKLESLLSLTSLRVLILSNNPLATIVPAVSSTVLANFRSLTLSGTRLTTVNGSVFKNFPTMKELNLSTEWLTSITEGFSSTPNMETLDLRGSHHLSYPSDLLKDLTSLRLVRANDFKLCCKTALPEGFDQENCFAPSDDIASCEDLLRSDVYRVFLWMFALLAVLGNVGSFVARFYLPDKSFQSGGQSSFNILVTNLSVADFLMGVYLTIIGVADHIYRGQYVWYVEKWKKSVACQTAGFLSFASSEVSAFFICLITLDRLMILRFPFGKLRFRKKSALVASGMAWIVGFVLAAVPLLPMSPHWEFYSLTGICIPLPFTDENQFTGYTYSFSVMIVLNLVLFILIAVGQVFIYITVRASSMAPAKKKASRDSAIARRLTTIVLSDFLCWFPVGLLGVLASTGIPISVDIRVAIAIFVLPFNSALNPFLYTFNIVMEKRRKAAEARILERLESRHFTELSRMEGRLPVQLTVTKETALNQIDGWLGVKVITMSDLASRFDMMPRMVDTTAPLHPE